MIAGPGTSPFYGTFIEAWPTGLARLSFSHEVVELSPADRRALVSRVPAIRSLLGLNGRLPYSNELPRVLAEALARLPAGAFMRLGACSFVTPHRGPAAVRSAAEAVQLLVDPGERAARMVHRCVVSGHPVALYLRRWHEIPPSGEFRLFIRDGVFVGASQYHHTVVFPGLSESVSAAQAEIGRFVGELVPQLPMPSVVADVWIDASRGALRTTLIEINPYMRVTGSALFDWDREDDFDGSLRFLDSERRVVRLQL